MSDLSDRFIAALASTEGGYTQLGDRFLRAWPIIEAELQKRDKEHFDSLVKAESECLEETEQLSAKLTEANKLLEQTIEVLERSAATFNLYMKARRYEADIAADQLLDDIPPLLDNLKAREKEGTE